MDRNQEYIRLLQEKNRMKRMMHEKTDDELAKEELERGFSTHFRGAHASKDPSSAMKASSSKPTVKVHSRAPPSDLIQRLMPTKGLGLEQEDEEPLDEYDTPREAIRVRSGSRSGSRGASRYRNMASDQESPQENAFSTSQQNAYAQVDSQRNLPRMDPAAVDLQLLQSMDLNNLLMSRIKSLSAEQKIAVLELLQEGPAAADAAIASVGDTAANDIATTTANTDENIHPDREEREDGDRAATASQKQAESPLRLAKASTPNRAVPAPAPVRPTVSVHVRIKIYSTWNAAKNVILQGLRLRYTLSEQRQVVDLLHVLTPRVQSGLTALSSTHESMRSLPALLGQSPRTAQGGAAMLWRAPISAQNPLELAFSGVLPDALLATLCADNAMAFDKSRLELFLWNGVGDIDSDSIASTNASPAKDVDVFVDDKCVWSGELAAEAKLCEISRASGAPAVLSRLEGTASHKVQLVALLRVPTASTKAPPASVVVAAAATPAVVPPSPLRGITPRAAPSPRSSRQFEEPRVKLEKDDRPEWLRGLGGNNLKSAASVLDSPKELRKSRQDEEEAFGNFDAPRSPAERSLATQRSTAKLRRRRNRDGGADDGAAPSSPSKHLQGSLCRAVDKQETESHLRRSLEAVQHAEKFNLNRLESTLLKRKPRRSFAEDMDRREDDATALHAETESVPFVRRSFHAEPSDAGALSRAEVSRTADSDAAAASAASAAPSRASKIDDVNAKLNNALTDLAEIMAALPKNRAADKKMTSSFSAGAAPVDVAVDAERDTLSNARNDNATALRPELSPQISKRNSFKLLPSADMPRGKCLRLEIFSTHGDQSYVGLNGLEIFNARGESLQWKRQIVSIAAVPADLAVLPGYEDDPRKAENLLDGVNATKDDLHQWLAPHMSVARDQRVAALPPPPAEDGEPEPLAVVTVTFASAQAISMIRVHNFNKSRTHNQRGAKHVRFYLDNVLIYDGDIKRATGQMKVSAADSQLLLFTEDKALIDQVPSPEKNSSKEDDQALEESVNSPNARPKTAIKAGAEQGAAASAFEADRAESPTTNFLNEVLNEVNNIDIVAAAAAARPRSPRPARERDASLPQGVAGAASSSSKTLPGSGMSDIVYHSSPSAASAALLMDTAQVLTVQAKTVRIEFDSTWGDRDHVGLAGMELLGLDGKAMDLNARWLLFDSTNDMFGAGSSGDRRVDNVLGGVNNTANDSFMWLAPLPYEKQRKQFLEIKFPSQRSIVGFRFWNFNGSYEATLRGCKHCTIFFDDRPSIKYVLRPGPECDGVDFCQTLLFDQYFQYLAEQRRMSALLASPSTYISPKLRQVTEIVTPPTGLLWKFSFFSNHGDDYYIGMDAIELFDMENKIVSIPRHGGHVSAVPHSVRDLSASESDPLRSDPRTPDKLFAKSFHQDSAAQSCWLAPLAKCMTESEREVAVKRSVGSIALQEYNAKKRAPMLPRENVVMVMFSYPVSIAAIRMYNYSKSVRRGVKDFAVHVDGKLVFLGSLLRGDEEPKSFPDARSVNRQVGMSDDSRTVGQAVVFSQELKVLNAHKDVVPPIGMLDQDVLCINERQVMVRSKTMYEPPNSSAVVMENPNTDLFKRPTTSFFS